METLNLTPKELAEMTIRDIEKKRQQSEGATEVFNQEV